MSASRARIVFDISTAVRWTGPPVGIVRVEREFAHWAKANLNGTVFVFFDPQTRSYRTLDDRWTGAILGGNVAVDLFSAPAPARQRRSDRIPERIRPAAMWVLQSRKSALSFLEGIRLRSKNARSRRIAEWLQKPLISEKYRRRMFHPDGTRRASVPYHTLLGEPLAFGADDTLLFVGAQWEHSDIDVVHQLRERYGFRLVVLCHDIIPLMFPQFYKPEDVAKFDRYYRVAFPSACLVLFTARSTEKDTRAYCAAHGIGINSTAVVPLGADSGGPVPVLAALPEGLEPGRYALLVSTIEPRKGHRMILNVWLRMLSEGLPQRYRFKLVFVGRPGWLVGDLLREMSGDPRLSDSVLVLTSAPDEQLAALYEYAAFCLYPSVYEGFGLPIIEAFSRGKAVLASNGGAIPEVVGGLSPCLAPRDEEQWHLMLSDWIADPTKRAPYEAAIRDRNKPMPWRVSAERFFATVARL